MRELIITGVMRAADTFMATLTAFLPRLVTMLTIIGAGTLLAWLMKVIVRRVLLLARFDTHAQRVGAAQMLFNAGFSSPLELLSRLAFWTIWLGFFFLSLIALEIQPLQDGVSRLLLFLPQIFVALFILF